MIAKAIINPDFTIEDIHKIRQYHYELTKDITTQEKILFIMKTEDPFQQRQKRESSRKHKFKRNKKETKYFQSFLITQKTRNLNHSNSISCYQMQEMGLEPTRYCYHRHLKPARLPIPPLLRTNHILPSFPNFDNIFCKKFPAKFSIIFSVKLKKIVDKLVYG